jgi:hypothetical protein
MAKIEIFGDLISPLAMQPMSPTAYTITIFAIGSNNHRNSPINDCHRRQLTIKQD